MDRGYCRFGLFILLQDQIAQLKAKMAANAKECEEINKFLKDVTWFMTCVKTVGWYSE